MQGVVRQCLLHRQFLTAWLLRWHAELDLRERAGQEVQSGGKGRVNFLYSLSLERLQTAVEPFGTSETTTRADCRRFATISCTFCRFQVAGACGGG